MAIFDLPLAEEREVSSLRDKDPSMELSEAGKDSQP